MGQDLPMPFSLAKSVHPPADGTLMLETISLVEDGLAIATKRTSDIRKRTVRYHQIWWHVWGNNPLWWYGNANGVCTDGAGDIIIAGVLGSHALGKEHCTSIDGMGIV